MRGVIRKTITLFIGMLAAAAIFVLSAELYIKLSESGNQRGVKNSRLSAEILPPEEELSESVVLSREDILERSLKSVVGISSVTNSPTDNAAGQTDGTWYMGSGVIATPDGYIITNQHVIGARPQRIFVTLANGETTEGVTVWSDSTLDLAVVKINGKNLDASKLGNAKKLRVGESVLAIGNPLSMQFQRTVTAGIISATGRSINIESDGGSNYMEDLIQTDASINPGNSGGPLLNSTGEVIGINTVKVTSAEGMGFAVPINVCIPIIERLQSVGEFHTPYLGLYAYTNEAARYLELDEGFSEGLFAAKLDESGPAFSAGIRYGDIITAIGNESVNTMLELREALFKRQPGEGVNIEFVRNDSRRKVMVVLSERS